MSAFDDPDQNGQNGFNATGVDIKYDSGIFMNHHQLSVHICIPKLKVDMNCHEMSLHLNRPFFVITPFAASSASSEYENI